MVYDKISERFVSSVMFFWLNLSFMYTENLPWCKIFKQRLNVTIEISLR